MFPLLSSPWLTSSDFLATLDQDREDKYQVVDNYKHNWWARQKPRDLNNTQISNLFTVKSCLVHYQREWLTAPPIIAESRTLLSPHTFQVNLSGSTWNLLGICWEWKLVWTQPNFNLTWIHSNQILSGSAQNLLGFAWICSDSSHRFWADSEQIQATMIFLLYINKNNYDNIYCNTVTKNFSSVGEIGQCHASASFLWSLWQCVTLWHPPSSTSPPTTWWQWMPEWHLLSSKVSKLFYTCLLLLIKIYTSCWTSSYKVV